MVLGIMMIIVGAICLYLLYLKLNGYDEIIILKKKKTISNEERQIIQSTGKLMENFHKNPSLKTLEEIRKNEKLIVSAIEWPYWMFLIRAYVKLNQDPKNIVDHKKLQKYNNKIKEFQDSTFIFSPEDLDSLWSLYYASGNLKYPKIVRKVVRDSKQKIEVRSAAIWSFNSHVKTNRLNLKEITKVKKIAE